MQKTHAKTCAETHAKTRAQFFLASNCGKTPKRRNWLLPQFNPFLSALKRPKRSRLSYFRNAKTAKNGGWFKKMVFGFITLLFWFYNITYFNYKQFTTPHIYM